MSKRCAVLLFFFFFLPCVLSARAEVNFYLDPSRLGVGARPLGMGKAYIGKLEDVNSLFMNPSALASMKEWAATSMSGKFINEIDYLNFGYAYPTDIGVFGVGIVNSGLSVPTAAATFEVVDGEIRIVPSTTEVGQTNYSSRVILLSYSREIFPKFLAGGNLKLFATNFSELKVSRTSSGQDIDLGFLYQITPQWNVAGVAQNILPFSMGGKLVYSDNYEEAIGSRIKVGTAFKAIPKVSLYADNELPTGSLPSLWHYGAELQLTDIVTIRLGQDQEMSGFNETATNLTAGVGLNWRGFSFDYAYHGSSDLPENTSSYFSLGYAVPEDRVHFIISQPQDRFVTDEAKILLKGKVTNLARIYELKVNGEKVVFDKKSGDLKIELPLSYRLNWLRVEAFTREGKLLKRERLRGLRLMSFADVKPPYFAVLPVEFLATLDIITGYPDGTFRPEGDINRAEMCTLLMKTRGTRDEGRGTKFKDVSDKHWASAFIAEASVTGVVLGYPDGTFQPKGLITRAEGVAMIVRFDGLSDGKILEAPFPDVPGRHWAAREIIMAKEAGFLKYLEEGKFEPSKKLTRGETAEILYRTRMVNEKINKMWEGER